MNRVCSRCKAEKVLTDFPKTPRPNEANLGHEGVCRTCVTDREAGRTARCFTCKVIKSVDQFRFKNGNRENHCKDCRNAFQRERRANPQVDEHRELRRKLPDYETLKQLHVEKGLTQAQIGEMFGVPTRSVQRTIKNRAMRRGEWPLLTDRERLERLKQGTQRSLEPGKYRVNSFALGEIVLDYCDEHGLSIPQFAARAGVQRGYIYQILGRGKETAATTAPAYALRILEVTGEPVPPGLRERAKKGLQPAPLPRLPRVADEHACASSPSATPDVAERVG